MSYLTITIINYMIPLKSQAIQTALTGDWTKAITLNETLLEENPDDIDTLNRLAFAFTSIGNTKQAKSLYYKVLALDLQNPIAIRNLKRLATNGSTKPAIPTLMNNLFIEEPGKTKLVELINIADKKIVSCLRSGEQLLIQVKRMKVFILDQQKQYVGMLPDDISKRLIEFINGGNEYEAFIKTVTSNKVIIFAKEVKRANKFKFQPSFLSTDKSKLSIDGRSKHVASSGNHKHEDADDNDLSDAQTDSSDDSSE